MAARTLTARFSGKVDPSFDKATRKVNRGLGGIGDHANKADRNTGKLKKALGGFAGGLAVGGVVLAAGAVKKLGGDVLGAASDASEAANVVGLVFGDQAKSMESFFDGAAKSMGISETAAKGAAANVGGLLKNVGFSDKATVDYSKNLLGLASDMGSAFNTDPADALQAISAGLRGESEPLKRYNVFLSDAALKAKAMEKGLYSGKGALDKNAKAQATLALLTEQTGDVQGDFANTSDGAANAQRRAGASMDDLKAKLGKGLLPAYESVLSFANNKLLPGMSDLGGSFKKVADSPLGKKMAELGAVIKDAVTPAVQFFQALWEKFGPVITAVVRNMVDTVIKVIGGLFKVIGGIFKLGIAILKGDWSGAWKAVKQIVSGGKDAVVGLFKGMYRNIKIIGGNIKDSFVGRMKSLKSGAVAAVSSIPKALGDVFRRAKSAVSRPIGDLFGWLNKKMRDPLNKITSKFGVTLPAFPKFHTGGEIPGRGERNITAEGGEGVLQRSAMKRIGKRGFDRLNAGGFGDGILDFLKDPGSVLRDLAAKGVSWAVSKVMDPITRTVGKTPPPMAGQFLAGMLKRVSSAAKSWGTKQQTNDPAAASHGLGSGPWVRALSRYSVGMPLYGYPGHTGADFPAPGGTPVYAVSQGRVFVSRDMAGSYGRHIKIAHAGNEQSVYAHLSARRVGVGDLVKAGQRIGDVGTTGNSTGNHLHLGMFRNGAVMNPQGFHGVRYDQGGMLPMGPSLTMNGTGHPEPVIPRDDYRLLMEAVKASLDGGSQTVVIDGRSLRSTIRSEIRAAVKTEPMRAGR